MAHPRFPLFPAVIPQGVTLLLASASLLTSGCASTVRVHERPAAAEVRPLDGIPFYVKRPVFLQTTTYQRSWSAVTLTVSTAYHYVKDGEFKTTPPATSKFVQEVGRQGLPDIQRLRGLVLEASARGADAAGVDVRGVIDAFKALPALDPETQLAELVGNTVETVLTVDYTRELYLNAPLPWFGDGTLETKLSPEGTLSEASATVHTGTNEFLGALPSLVPLSEFVTATITDPVEAEAAAAAVSDITAGVDSAPPTVQRVVSLSLSIEPRGYVDVLTKTYEVNPAGTPGTLVELHRGDHGVTFQRRPLTLAPVGGSKPEPGASGESAPGAIRFSGEIAIPKQ